LRPELAKECATAKVGFSAAAAAAAVTQATRYPPASAEAAAAGRWCVRRLVATAVRQSPLPRRPLCARAAARRSSAARAPRPEADPRPRRGGTAHTLQRGSATGRPRCTRAESKKDDQGPSDASVLPTLAAVRTDGVTAPTAEAAAAAPADGASLCRAPFAWHSSSVFDVPTAVAALRFPLGGMVQQAGDG